MTNEGTLDRIVRVAIGFAILALAFVGPRTPLGYIGIIPIVTGAIGFCPLYRLVGLSTCAVAKK
jgi:hypothetical protein